MRIGVIEFNIEIVQMDGLEPPPPPPLPDGKPCPPSDDVEPLKPDILALQIRLLVPALQPRQLKDGIWFEEIGEPEHVLNHVLLRGIQLYSHIFKTLNEAFGYKTPPKKKNMSDQVRALVEGRFPGMPAKEQDDVIDRLCNAPATKYDSDFALAAAHMD